MKGKSHGNLFAIAKGCIKANIPPERIIMHPDSIPSALTAVRNNLGIGVLPQFIVDREPSLVAAPLRLPVTPFELWIMTHRGLRRSAPVTDLMDMVATYVLASSPKSST